MVIGASTKPERFSNIAIKMLLEYNHEVVALAKRKGIIHGIEIKTEFPVNETFHTVTLYLGPNHQLEYYKLLRELHPRRVIFNPGTENTELKRQLELVGIEAIEGCTLVMLRTGQF